MPRLSFLCSALFFSTMLSATAQADSKKAGLEIALKNDKVNQGFKSESSKLEMKLINAYGDITTRSMLSQVLEGSDEGDLSLTTFEWPADVKGTKMLTHSMKSTDDKQWLYLPALKRVKRISSKNKSGSFMGSEFSYEDLGSQEVEKFDFDLLGETQFEGRKVWHMVRIPKDKRSGYSKQVVWVDQEYHNPLKIEYFDRKGVLLKVGLFKDYKKFGKHWRVGLIDMTNVQTKKRSLITWTQRSLGAEVDEELFESETMTDG